MFVHRDIFIIIIVHREYVLTLYVINPIVREYLLL